MWRGWRCPYVEFLNTVRMVMNQTSKTTFSLSDLDQMDLEQAQSLPFEDRDALLDLVIADGLHDATSAVSYRTGLYTDYFEEDLVRFLKLKAVRVHCRGITSSNFEGNVVGETDVEQYRACLRHVETVLTAARTGFDRVVNLVVFLTDMDKWPVFNEVYQEFIPNPPCRAVIGTTGLAQKPLAIEIVDCDAYRVAE